VAKQRSVISSRTVNRPLFRGQQGIDPITLHKMEAILRQGRELYNQRASLTALANSAGTNNASLPLSGTPTSMQKGRYYTAELDPRRNMAADCGWPITVSPYDYKELIDRDSLAGLVNSIYPLESWQVEPDVYEDDDEKTNTPFEQSYADLHEMLHREPSYHDGESGSLINQILLNLDQLAGYGRYGALLIGLDDGMDLMEPVVPKKGMRCTYLRPFPEHLARITMFDMDWNSPRYGRPLTYLVTFADPQDMSTTGVNENFMARQVHWSRIVHVNDFWHHPSSSPIFAIERCRPVINNILDARKIRGASAEGYYQACFNALHFGTHPSLGPDVDIDRDSIIDMYEQFANGLQRLFITSGMQVQSIAPNLPDATPHLLIQYVSILMKMRIPMRIAMGSERGELASGDDKVKWVQRLISRENSHNTPRIIVPVVDRLINIGVLERPKRGYKVKWGEIDLSTAAERITALFQRTQAYGVYATQDVERYVAPLEYMTEFDDIPADKAKTMLDAAGEHMDEVQQDQADMALEQAAQVGSVSSPVTGPRKSPTSSTPMAPPNGKSGTPATVPLQNSRGQSTATVPLQNARKKDKESKKVHKPKRLHVRKAVTNATVDDLTRMYGYISNEKMETDFMKDVPRAKDETQEDNEGPDES
jgi:hypothetical protein